MVSMPFDQVIRLLLSEAFIYRKAIVAVFVITSISLLALGTVWPKNYTAKTTIIVDEKNIIDPLLAGRAVAVDVTVYKKLAAQILYSRKTLLKILETGGWLENNPSDLDIEKMSERVMKKTRIVGAGRNLVRIEYTDVNAVRAYKVTKKYGELFINDSVISKEEESRAAFEFINKQVKEYHTKLTDVETKIKIYRSENPDARPGDEAQVSTRINELRESIEKTSLDYQEAKIKLTSLEKQLSGEADITISLSREGQIRTRMAELHSKLDTLRLNYHESYPDIVRIKEQIEQLRNSIVSEKGRRLKAKAEAKAGGEIYVDEGISSSPLYEKLRAGISETKTEVETLRTRLKERKARLKHELDRSKRIHGGEATMVELTRDYQVNRDIYQDLLRRRENARVSMNLNRDRQETVIKTHEPAVIPLRPNGLRFIHFMIGGIIFGLALPFGVLYGFQQVDPRIRNSGIITEKNNIPVIAHIPHMSTPAETAAILVNLRHIVLIISVTGIVYLIISALKLAAVI